jgi:type I restriction enzyme S subunit
MMNSAKPKIDMDTIRSIQIPIPSAEIQKYIGDKVRRAEELREEAKAAKKDYEYIIQDIYSDSNIIKFPKGFYTVQSHDFDDKHLRIDSNFYNPLYKNGKLNSYKNVKLSKLVDLKKNCKIQAEEEYAYFEIGDLSTSNILDGKERVKGSELPGRAKLKLEKDDIIVSLVQESIEVTSYVDKELNNTLTTNGCAVLIPRDKSLSGYLYAIISSKYFIAQKCRYISGTNIRSMSKDDLLDMKIPIVEDEIITKVNGLVLKEFTCLRESKQLILEAKQDVEDLIEGKFDMSKLNNESSTESRC